MLCVITLATVIPACFKRNPLLIENEIPVLRKACGATTKNAQATRGSPAEMTAKG